MTPEEKAKQVQEDLEKADMDRADKVRKDAEEAANQGETLNKILSCLDALAGRMDALEGAPRGKGRESESEVEGEIEEPGKPRELGADSRKDSQMIRKDSASEDLEELESHAKERGEPAALAADSAGHRRLSDGLLATIQADVSRAYDCWVSWRVRLGMPSVRACIVAELSTKPRATHPHGKTFICISLGASLYATRKRKLSLTALQQARRKSPAPRDAGRSPPRGQRP